MSRAEQSGKRAEERAEASDGAPKSNTLIELSSTSICSFQGTGIDRAIQIVCLFETPEKSGDAPSAVPATLNLLGAHATGTHPFPSRTRR